MLIFKKISISVIVLALVTFTATSQAQAGAASLTHQSFIEAISQNDLERVQHHIHAGVNVNKSAYRGLSPLMLAVNMKSVPIATLLIDNGADIDHYNHDRMTALHYAAYMGDAEMVKLLLFHYANPHATAKNGRKAIHYAKLSNNEHVTALLAQ